MSVEFLPNFIQECLSEGKNTPAKMCEEAQERIRSLDQKIKEIEELRNERNNLYAIIRQFGGNKKKKTEYKTIDFSVPPDKLSDLHTKICIGICDIIESIPEGVENGEIITLLESAGIASYEEQEDIFWSVKWLYGRDIISKNAMKFIKGKSWKERPIDN